MTRSTIAVYSCVSKEGVLRMALHPDLPDCEWNCGEEEPIREFRIATALIDPNYEPFDWWRSCLGVDGYTENMDEDAEISGDAAAIAWLVAGEKGNEDE